MRAGVIQPCYVPWRGYFDFIRSVDVFVLYDNVQFSRGSWQNRNRLKGPHGVRWLSVPVHAKLGTPINRVAIASRNQPDWRQQHLRQLGECLGEAKYGADAVTLWSGAVTGSEERLAEVNAALIRAVCRYLDIRTPIVSAADFGITGATATERLVCLLRLIGADAYLSGPAAKAYLDQSQFCSAGIRLEYKRYEYAPYPQLWGEFLGDLSVLDLIANCGPESAALLHSRVPDEVAVS